MSAGQMSAGMGLTASVTGVRSAVKMSSTVPTKRMPQLKLDSRLRYSTAAAAA